jgi:tetratricopeptide (TPR) repeat protein
MNKNYEKSVKNAEMSLDYNKTIKAYYRLGQAYKQLNKLDKAVESFKAAVLLDVSDPNDV